MEKKVFYKSVSKNFTKVFAVSLVYFNLNSGNLAAQPFITEWFYRTGTSRINFYAHTSGAVNYVWKALPSGNAGTGTFSATTPQLVTLTVNVPPMNTVELSMAPDSLLRFYNYDPAISGFNPHVLNLMSVRQWGSVQWSSMEYAFAGCLLFDIAASDFPDLTNVTNMDWMFWRCQSLNSPNVSSWNVSNVTTMKGMFSKATSFNQSLVNWNVKNVTDMEQMFDSATSFNQHLIAWNTSSVKSMRKMFRYATSFDKPLANWNTSSVTDMSEMFAFSTAFNQSIGSWDVSNVVNMANMFENATSFNASIGGWNTSNVKDMARMFAKASSFNQNLSGWNVSNVITMQNMFDNAAAFNNSSIGAWVFNPSVNLIGMLDNSGIDCDNYSEILKNWDANPLTPNNLVLGASGLQYGTTAVSARNNLINVKGWTIYGDIASSLPCGPTTFVSSSNGVVNLVRYNDGKVFITGKGLKNVTVFDASGRIVASKNLNNENQTTLDHVQGIKGLVLLKIHTQDGMYNHKLILD